MPPAMYSLYLMEVDYYRLTFLFRGLAYGQYTFSERSPPRLFPSSKYKGSYVDIWDHKDGRPFHSLQGTTGLLNPVESITAQSQSIHGPSFQFECSGANPCSDEASIFVSLLRLPPHHASHS